MEKLERLSFIDDVLESIPLLGDYMRKKREKISENITVMKCPNCGFLAFFE